MMPSAGVAEQLSDDMPGNPFNAGNGHIIQLSEEDLARGARAHPAAGKPGRGDAVAGTVEEAESASSEDDSVLSFGAGDIPKKPLGYRFAKRAFDIAFSACVIVVGFVPGLVLCAVISADTKGSPIYLSTRLGRNGRPFRILKFRTMVADADDLEKHLNAKQLEQWHKEHKVDGDPRITKLGEFLRSSSIDEFPQFVNVLLGQMSTIGCRAITQEEAGYFGNDQALLLSLRPGITGMWQTGPRNIATFDSGLRQKLELMYIANASVKLDTRLFFRTFKTMIERTGR